MRDNLTNSSDTTVVNKKFFSHVKSTSSCHRIPECINYKSILRNNPEEQAELFSEYFLNNFQKNLSMI